MSTRTSSGVVLSGIGDRLKPAQTLIALRWFLLAILIALAPYHAFFATWLNFGFLLSAWREIVAGMIMLLIAVEVIFLKRARLKLDVVDGLILALTAVALAWLPFQTGALQWLFGFRFDIYPLLLLFFLKRVEWPAKEKLWKIFLWSAVPVLLFGILHAAILPQNFLMNFGYGEYRGDFMPGETLSSCQYLEHSQSICRAMSTFGGPTRYGTYLLLILGILIGGLTKERMWRIPLLILVLVNIALTFSRSIWIGALCMAGGAFFLFVPRKIQWKIWAVTAFFAIAAVGASMISASWKGAEGWPPPILKTIFLRENSSSEHLRLFMDGLEKAKENPYFGFGLGTAGPASGRFGEKLLTENWYLQIVLEMGTLGLTLWLFLMYELGRELLRRKVGLFLALLGISIAAIFTHAFEETTTMLALAAFIGTQLHHEKNSPTSSSK